jgi:excisionase family DNA binding protein
MEQLLSVVDTARTLAISPWTVRLYIRAGRLNPVRIGTRVLLEQSELERFIAASKAVPPSTTSAQLVAENGL